MHDAIATIDVMQLRLQAWAAWLTGGGSALGFPTKSVLHESWMPPSAGMRPSMVTGGTSTRQEQAMHRIIQGLSVRLQNTLVVVYVMRAKPVEQARLLECQESTVRARLAEARRLIGMALDQ